MVWLTIFLLLQPSSADTWRGLVVAPENRCTPLQRGRLPLPRERRAGHRRSPGRCVESLRLAGVQVDPRDRHRTHRGPRRSPRIGPVRVRRRDAPPLRHGSAEPHAGLAAGQPGSTSATAMQPTGCRRTTGVGSRRRVVAIQSAYGLTIDRREADALEAVLVRCEGR